MLAEQYRREGYAVEHVGTGGTGRNFDGGIDLKLRKDDAYILVQCKHWNAMQVPHNDVHELIGVMVNQGATGAILVTSGEFTRAAIEAAAKQGHVQLIDGDDLRAMLGPLPELAEEPDPDARWRRGAKEEGAAVMRPSPAKALLDRAAERLIVAAEDRIRGGGRRTAKTTVAAFGVTLLLKFALAALIFVVFLFAMRTIISTYQRTALQQVAHLQDAARTRAAQAQLQPAMSAQIPTSAQAAATPSSNQFDAYSYGRRDPDPCRELVDWKSGTTIDRCKRGTPSRPTDNEVRDSQRKADEAMKVIEANTPDM